jgi:hypothetical protein
MAGATLTTLSNIMKNFYLGPVQSQFNNEILVNQLLGFLLRTWWVFRRFFRFTLRARAASARVANWRLCRRQETSPTRQAVYDLAYHYGRAQVSGQAIHKTSSSAGAFLQAMKSELDGLRDDLALDFARQVYGTGDGVVATLAVNTTSRR